MGMRTHNKRCAARLRVGASYWSLCMDDGKSSWQQWVVRTIRLHKDKGRTYDYKGWKPFDYMHVTLIRKDQFTWVKKSKKNDDFGWADRIQPCDRRTLELLRVSHADLKSKKYELPFTLCTTKLQAALFALHQIEQLYKDSLRKAKEEPEEREEWLEDAEEEKKNIASIKRIITKLRKAKS